MPSHPRPRAICHISDVRMELGRTLRMTRVDSRMYIRMSWQLASCAGSGTHHSPGPAFRARSCPVAWVGVSMIWDICVTTYEYICTYGYIAGGIPERRRGNRDAMGTAGAPPRRCSVLLSSSSDPSNFPFVSSNTRHSTQTHRSSSLDLRFTEIVSNGKTGKTRLLFVYIY